MSKNYDKLRICADNDIDYIQELLDENNTGIEYAYDEDDFNEDSKILNIDVTFEDSYKIPHCLNLSYKMFDDGSVTVDKDVDDFISECCKLASSKIEASQSVMSADNIDEPDSTTDDSENLSREFREPRDRRSTDRPISHSFDDDVDDNMDDRLSEISDDIEDLQDSVEEIHEDDTSIEIENNIDGHYIAECDRCKGIFISAVLKSDNDVELIHGKCPLCGEETDQLLKWTIESI